MTLQNEFSRSVPTAMGARGASPSMLAAELARAGVQVTPQTIYNWLAGKNMPPIITMENVCSALRILIVAAPVLCR